LVGIGNAIGKKALYLGIRLPLVALEEPALTRRDCFQYDLRLAGDMISAKKTRTHDESSNGALSKKQREGHRVKFRALAEKRFQW
jgi:hypothetical protein